MLLFGVRGVPFDASGRLPVERDVSETGIKFQSSGLRHSLLETAIPAGLVVNAPVRIAT